MKLDSRFRNIRLYKACGVTSLLVSPLTRSSEDSERLKAGGSPVGSPANDSSAAGMSVDEKEKGELGFTEEAELQAISHGAARKRNVSERESERKRKERRRDEKFKMRDKKMSPPFSKSVTGAELESGGGGLLCECGQAGRRLGVRPSLERGDEDALEERRLARLAQSRPQERHLRQKVT